MIDVFESLQIEHTVSKDEFKAAEDGLREALIDVQLELLAKPDFPVIVLLTGLDFLGRSAAAKQLMSWMDPRHIKLYAHYRVREDELAHPRMWRYWRVLPPKGKIGLFLNSWYDGPISNYLLGKLDESEYRAQIRQIVRFERMLAEEGTLFLKFLFFIPKKESVGNFKNVTKDKIAAWKMSDEDARVTSHLIENFDSALGVLEDAICETSTSYAPWHPLRSTDARYRDMAVSKRLIKGIGDRLSAGGTTVQLSGSSTIGGEGDRNILDTLDLGQSLRNNDYKKSLAKAQRRVSAATIGKKFEKRGLVAVFEGNDAAGKGGCIRRFVAALDPRMLELVPVASPSEEERAQPYLWRFWRHVPEHGHVTIFDRSWYGRILVERVEGFCSETDWRRAYEEIRAFESELSDHGLIVVKFWLAIDRDEQLRRFKEREEVAHKHHKITDEDWRNRDKWDDYRYAVHDMIDRTSTRNAPWTLVEANDKRFARVKVLQTIADRLDHEL